MHCTPQPDDQRHSILKDHLADSILATPGVVDLIPTLAVSIAHLRHGTAPAPCDAVTTSIRDHHVDLDVDITTSASHQARQTCQRVRANLRTTIADAGLTPGSIHINVLLIQTVAPS